MSIECGSQNASRIAGVYAYPSYEYSNQPVSATDKVSGSRVARNSYSSAIEQSSNIGGELNTRLDKSKAIEKIIDLAKLEKIEKKQAKSYNSYENSYGDRAFQSNGSSASNIGQILDLTA